MRSARVWRSSTQLSSVRSFETLSNHSRVRRCMALSCTAAAGRKSFAHAIGTSVNDTTAEIRIVTASVMANSRNRRPTTSPMNRSGMSTAIRRYRPAR